MAKMARSEKVKTPEGRVSHPHVFVARENTLTPGAPPKFECALVFPPGTDLSALKKAARSAVVAQWGTSIPPKLKDPFLDAHEKDPANFPPGSVMLRMSKNSAQGRPGLVDANVQEIMSQADFYGGCYACVTTNAYCWQVATGCGVSFGLINIQKTRDGEPFGFRDDPTDDFKPVDPESLGGEAPIDDAAPSFLA